MGGDRVLSGECRWGGGGVDGGDVTAAVTVDMQWINEDGVEIGQKYFR